ncbi:DNA polymerase III subunit alpha [Staphylococcus lutrae]|uniref:DNA polymerase III subunit alpha n=1 Tax=Staphylococcus lutrae TaxID=155085 RepID=A0AAC9RSA0_9STAP|nr:DNA polymerase III subunit alpha [Staphylococcus lutrae]ARJ49992.1 DNA polymerase III subunit alpha [Staphylococcus lutrae]PNZ38925.1 DNA polymerase III subunit alpha [Staphylococcus lutrae]
MVAHLNIHTAYDLLNSSVTIKGAVQRAKDLGYSAIAITDLNVMYGVPQFYDECVQKGIKPLLGITVYLTDQLNVLETVVIAKNNDGLQNLFKLSSEIKVKGLKHVSIYEMKAMLKNTVVIFKKMTMQEKHWIEEMPEETSCFVDHRSDADGPLPHVFMEAAYYEEPADRDALKVLHAIRDNTKVNLVETNEPPSQHIKEIDTTYNQAWLHRTEDIAAMCDAHLIYHQALLPEFKTPDDRSANDYLWSELQRALVDFGLTTTRYRERLQYEYEVITQMGYADYFLIVSDLIRYAKSNGVMVGPGRGSSAGSLVSYLLNITTIDPLQYDLLFERFLNPERVTMPDIDIDFEDTQREKVIQYVQEKYGDYRVAGIVTFGHLLAKAVARDVGRVMGFDETTLSEASKLIPSKLGVTLDEAYSNERFKAFVHRNYRHEKWFEFCKKLEGLPRNTSTHAAGVIVNDQPLFESIPLTEGETGLLTQWTMTEAERIGLLKIDFLGLRNLTIIHQIIKQVKRDLHVDIDMEAIPFNDKAVFDLLSRGDTTGIFQLESEGVRRVLQKLKPEHFEDIVAVTSLYRPGPMEEIPTYIRRRHDPGQVRYLHPDLAPILQRTYGVIIYQEQIMQIASRFAGFTYGEADILRRAMSKKNREVLLSERQHFIDGAKEKGYMESISGQIFDLILKFADYGFPRAHAVSYSKIAYTMAYLKVHYPTYFYANILSNVIGNETKTRQMIHESKQQRIKIHGPHINKSQWRYVATKEGVYISLGAIKGVGYQSVQTIVRERHENGEYKDFFDFCKRIPGRVRTRRFLQALIFTGAMDCFGRNRATLLQSIDKVSDSEMNIDIHFVEAFSTPKQEYKEVKEIPDQQLSDYEKQYLGFYVSTHPVEKLFLSKQYLGIFSLNSQAERQPILITLDQVRVIRTKQGQQMAFVELNDGLQTMDGVIFPKVYQQLSEKLEAGQIYIVWGKFEERKAQQQLIIDQLSTLAVFEAKKREATQKIVIREGLTDDLQARFLTQTQQSGIAVYQYIQASNQFLFKGYLASPEQQLDLLLKSIEPAHIRLL